MKTLITLILTLLAFISQANAQPYYFTYRTDASGDWTDPIWEVLDTSGAWVDVTGYPESTSDTDFVESITIRNGHNIIISSNINATQIYVESGGAITINSGASLYIGRGLLSLGSNVIITGLGSIKTNSGDIFNTVGLSLQEEAKLDVDLEVQSGLTVISTTSQCYIKKKITVASGSRLYFPNNNFNTLNYYLNGEIVNNGLISGWFLHFNGPKITNNDTIEAVIYIDTNVLLAGNGIWGYFDLTVNAGRTLTLLNDITLSIGLNLERGSYLDLNSKTLTISDEFLGQSLGLKVDSAASTSSTGLIRTKGNNISIYNNQDNFGMINAELEVISGTTHANAGPTAKVNFLNNVTVYSGATLTGGPILFNGDFVNYGTLISLDCIVRSPNFSNFGLISADLNFDSVTNIQGNGVWGFKYTIKESRSVTLLSDITLTQCDLRLENNSTLNLNSHTINLAGTQSSAVGLILDSNSTITISGLVNMQNNNGIQINSGNFNAPLKVDNGIMNIISNNFNNEPSIFNNTVTIDSGATVNAYAQINGNLMNNGIIAGNLVRFFGTSLLNNGSIIPEFRFESVDSSLHYLQGTGSFEYQSRITNGTHVLANSDHQLYELRIDSGGTFDITNRTIKVSGSEPIINNGTFLTSNSTIEFNESNGAYQYLPTANINYDNIRINVPNEVRLTGNLTVPSQLIVSNGDLDVVNYIITLTPAATLLETPGNTVKGTQGGYIATTRDINSPSGLNVGGLGAVLTTTANLGMTEIRRSHWLATISGREPILRHFDIIPTNNTDLDATLSFRYDDSELNGNFENGLRLYKSTDNGANYFLQDGIVDSTNNSITLSGINDFSRWSAAAPAVFASIKLIIEGLYDSDNNLLNRKDTVRAYLRNINPPFDIVDSSIAVIDSLTFAGNFLFQNAASGSYYIQSKHRNSIETWSKDGGETYVTGSLFSYDFTSAQSQAFGNNLKLISPHWCIFSGDVTDEGTIDLADVLIIYNDALNFAIGYNTSDINGDGFVDLSDMLIANNNSNNFVAVIRP